jgi:hypothetical protein
LAVGSLKTGGNKNSNKQHQPLRSITGNWPELACAGDCSDVQQAAPMLTESATIPPTENRSASAHHHLPPCLRIQSKERTASMSNGLSDRSTLRLRPYTLTASHHRSLTSAAIRPLMSDTYGFSCSVLYTCNRKACGRVRNGCGGQSWQGSGSGQRGSY